MFILEFTHFRPQDGFSPIVGRMVLSRVSDAVSRCSSFIIIAFHLLLIYTIRICWPFETDQPAAAAHLTHNLKVAFELIEVRTGEKGLKPIFRTGRKAKGTREAVGVEIREIIDSCRSEQGDMIRKNAEGIREKFSKTWEADGAGRREFLSFLTNYNVKLA